MSKLILITGISKGLGYAMTEGFIQQGHTVIGCARSSDAINKIRQKFSAPNDFTSVDVANEQLVKKWDQDVLQKYSPPDIVINNAAIINYPAPLWEIGSEEFSDLIDINIKGVVNIIRHFVPAMVKKKRGIIVNFSSCNLFYKPYFEEKKVLLIDIKMKAADIFKQRFTIEDDWDDKNCIDSIPQYDKPKKMIEAILLIHQGITNSYELGYKLGNRGKKDVYISRHGQYAKQALEALKLITRMRQGKKWLTELTQKGRLIAEAPNEDLQVRLLIEAMLSYPPIWRIIDAVSLKQSQLNSVLVLNDEVVKELTFPEVLKGADTSNRRSQALKNWIKWISKKSGIPIRIHEEGVQLTIPMLFAEVLDSADTD